MSAELAAVLHIHAPWQNTKLDFIMDMDSVESRLI